MRKTRLISSDSLLHPHSIHNVRLNIHRQKADVAFPVSSDCLSARKDVRVRSYRLDVFVDSGGIFRGTNSINQKARKLKLTDKALNA